MKLTSVQISDIRTDGDTQNRCEFDRDLVSEYLRAMHEGAVFPPMLVFFDGTDYWLADGFHRHAAYVDIGQAFVDVQVKEGSLRDAQLYSFSANASHGKRRTNADKRKAVLAMLADAEWCQWSNNQIAKVCMVHHSMVDRIRNESLAQSASEKPAERTYTTKHGTEAKMKTAKIGKKSNPVKDALDAGEITPEQASEIEGKPSVIQQQLVEKAKEQKKEDDEYTPPPLDLEEEERLAVQALEEHESRMAQLALLMEEDGEQADMVRQFQEMSRQIEKKDREVSSLRQQVGFLTNEINFYKQQIKRYKAVAMKYNKQQAA